MQACGTSHSPGLTLREVSDCALVQAPGGFGPVVALRRGGKARVRADPHEHVGQGFPTGGLGLSLLKAPLSPARTQTSQQRRVLTAPWPYQSRAAKPQASTPLRGKVSLAVRNCMGGADSRRVRGLVSTSKPPDSANSNKTRQHPRGRKKGLTMSSESVPLDVCGDLVNVHLPACATARAAIVSFQRSGAALQVGQKGGETQAGGPQQRDN